MFQKIVILNVVLLSVIAVGIARLRRDAVAFANAHRVEQIQPDSDKPLPKAAAGVATAAAQDWNNIAAHNPFSFDRNDVTLVITPPAAEQPKRPKPILFGTMTLGADHIAMLGPGDSGNRASRPVRAGEVFDGWTVLEILDKSVSVQWEKTTKESLILNDPTAQVARLSEKTGGGVSAPQVPASPIPTPGPATTQAAPPAPTQPPPASNGGKKQKLVHTPFGDKYIDEDQ
jgi:hypothetical protein